MEPKEEGVNCVGGGGGGRVCYVIALHDWLLLLDRLWVIIFLGLGLTGK